ncbi:hypothetical protein [Niveibacterium terrae]|uniref:hypothetical protein n=1 Tax=Niveibacterium terrae TaxID=3373598 RepID=UPI003A93A898
MIKPLIPRHLLLSISPGRLEARLLETRLIGRPPRLVACHSSPLSSELDLGNAIPAALSGLPQTPRRTRVVLSDTFCRYFMLTRPQGTARRSELEAAMQLRLRSLFGEDPEHWMLSADARLFNREDLVCALPRAFHQNLLAALDAANLSLLSLRPYWVSCCADRARQRRRGRHWLLAADADALTLGLFEDGRCRAVCSRRRTDEDSDLQAFLSREQVLFPAPPEEPGDTLWLYGAAAVQSLKTPVTEGGPQQRIRTPGAFGSEAAV